MKIKCPYCGSARLEVYKKSRMCKKCKKQFWFEIGGGKKRTNIKYFSDEGYNSRLVVARIKREKEEVKKDGKLTYCCRHKITREYQEVRAKDKEEASRILNWAYNDFWALGLP